MDSGTCKSGRLDWQRPADEGVPLCDLIGKSLELSPAIPDRVGSDGKREACQAVAIESEGEHGRGLFCFNGLGRGESWDGGEKMLGFRFWRVEGEVRGP